MTLDEAQADLRRAFVGGGPGTVVSGIVWLAAALIHDRHGVGPAFGVLFVGGMLIFPVTLLLCRLVFRREIVATGNRLGRIVPESTVAMIGGLFAAWLFLPTRPEYVFPLSAIAIGTHYAVFKTAYGDYLFWLLGALVTAVGLVTILGNVRFPIGPIWVVGLLEVVVGVTLAARAITSKGP